MGIIISQTEYVMFRYRFRIHSKKVIIARIPFADIPAFNIGDTVPFEELRIRIIEILTTVVIIAHIYRNMKIASLLLETPVITHGARYDHVSIIAISCGGRFVYRLFATVQSLIPRIIQRTILTIIKVGRKSQGRQAIDLPFHLKVPI